MLEYSTTYPGLRMDVSSDILHLSTWTGGANELFAVALDPLRPNRYLGVLCLCLCYYVIINTEGIDKSLANKCMYSVEKMTHYMYIIIA